MFPRLSARPLPSLGAQARRHTSDPVPPQTTQMDGDGARPLAPALAVELLATGRRDAPLSSLRWTGRAPRLRLCTAEVTPCDLWYAGSCGARCAEHRCSRRVPGGGEGAARGYAGNSPSSARCVPVVSLRLVVVWLGARARLRSCLLRCCVTQGNYGDSTWRGIVTGRDERDHQLVS